MLSLLKTGLCNRKVSELYKRFCRIAPFNLISFYS